MKKSKKSSQDAGFTLIELLIVIVIIGVISAVVFVALDPLTRFKDARDSRRWSAVSNILNAIKVDQIDNGGTYITAVADATSGEVFMITDGAVSSGCDDQNAYCDTNVTDDDNCINLAGLVTEGYLGDVPVSPNGSGTWSTSITGYTLQRDTTGIITIRACESENTSEIWSAR
jgi:prepilin-type N-terminal cleavage/methylation domain-containing protein